MTYEAEILIGASKIGVLVKLCQEAYKSIAVHSHFTDFWKDGTFGQLQTMSNYQQMQDRFQLLIDVVQNSLRDMPRAYKNLLIQIYLLKKSKKKICDKYNVSKQFLYRKIRKANILFYDGLKKQGFTYEIFKSKYSDIDFSASRLALPKVQTNCIFCAIG